jgi:hypothetical protein
MSSNDFVNAKIDDSGLPNTVAQFFKALTISKNVQRLLVRDSDIGLLGAWLAEERPKIQVDVLTTHKNRQSLIRPKDCENLSIHIGSVEKMSHTSDYDTIFSLRVFGVKKSKKKFDTDDGPITLNDKPYFLEIPDLANVLRKSGFMALIVPPQFGFEPSQRSVKNNLTKFGLHLNALLSFKPRTFRSHDIAANMAIISRNHYEDLFVASIPESNKEQAELIQRLWDRQEADIPRQGQLISGKEFFGFPAHEAKEKAKGLAKSKGYTEYRFGDIVTINQPTKKSGNKIERFDDAENAVYLATMANTPATTQQDKLPKKLKSYLQLLVDTKCVVPEYLAQLLNTKMGRSIRESAMSGAVIPKILPRHLAETKLYLVPKRNQAQAISARNSIRKLEMELKELEARTWEQPRKISEVNEALQTLNHKERLDEWIETLPFPLASILRSYHAIDTTDKDKYERLLNFFEATTVFLAAIHLSAFRSHETEWQSVLPDLRKILEKENKTFALADFGLWRIIAENLAAKLRRLLHDKKNSGPEFALSLYRTTNLSTLEMFSEKSISALLQRMNKCRNRWASHGGSPTPSESKQRHEALLSALDDLRTVFGRKFLDYELVEPKRADEVREGPVYHYSANRVMGSNPLLEQTTIITTTAATTGRLYLHNPGNNELLDLIKVIQLHDKEQPASYFHNSWNSPHIKLVAWSAKTSSTKDTTSPELESLFAEFT